MFENCAKGRAPDSQYLTFTRPSGCTPPMKNVGVPVIPSRCALAMSSRTRASPSPAMQVEKRVESNATASAAALTAATVKGGESLNRRSCSSQNLSCLAAHSAPAPAMSAEGWILSRGK